MHGPIDPDIRASRIRTGRFRADGASATPAAGLLAAPRIPFRSFPLGWQSPSFAVALPAGSRAMSSAAPGRRRCVVFRGTPSSSTSVDRSRSACSSLSWWRCWRTARTSGWLDTCGQRWAPDFWVPSPPFRRWPCRPTSSWPTATSRSAWRTWSAAWRPVWLRLSPGFGCGRLLGQRSTAVAQPRCRMITAVLVAVAAAVGAVCRYAVDLAIQRRHRGVFPLGTMTINVVGSLILGVVTGLASRHGLECARHRRRRHRIVWRLHHLLDLDLGDTRPRRSWCQPARVAQRDRQPRIRTRGRCARSCVDELTARLRRGGERIRFGPWHHRHNRL